MKTPETPRTNASTKSTDTEKPSATISVDSKGTASPGASAKKAETASAAKPGISASGGTSKADDSKNAASTPKSDPKTDAAKSTTKPSTPVKRKSVGGKAMVLFVLIIVGALATGWLTRAIWWRDAEPHLAQYVPDGILAEIAPDGLDADTASTNTVTATDSPDKGSSTIPAPSEDATMAETGDGAIKTENDLPVAGDTGASVPDSAAIPDGSVVIAPDLSERLSRLEGTINVLRERLDSERGDTLNNTVARRMAEIETRTAPIEELARVESELAGVASEMRELSSRLSKMEEEVRETAGLRVESRGQAIAMAVTILRDSLQRGGPFMIALNQLERSAGDDAVILEQIETLKPLAEQGAPTLEKLRQSFPVMAQDAVAAATDDHSGSVLEATWANIKKLVPIRRVDAAGEESLEGRLVLAENALAQNDLDGAVTALQGVEGDHAKAAVNDWLRAAQHRQTLDAAIASLSAHAIGLLTGAEGSQ